MLKTFILGVIIGSILLLITGVGAMHLQSQVKRSPEYADATPVQLGVMTHQQRVHGRLYDDYKQLNSGQTIRDVMALSPDEDIIINVHLPLLVGTTGDPITPEKIYQGLARNSDAVIRGIVTEKSSQITENEGFIFTDYKVVISEVLKDNVLSPITIDSTITVTRPGGKIMIEGRLVKAIDESYKPLKIKSEVALFLKYIPETGEYKPVDPMGSFELIDSMVQPLTGLSFPRGGVDNKKANEFLNIIRSVSKD